MRSIDVISQGIDNDLLKYQRFILCEITAVKKTVFGSLILQVISMDDEDSVVTVDNSSRTKIERKSFTAICASPMFFWPYKIKEKYNALVINIIKDVNATPIAILVPKEFEDPFSDELREKEKTAVQATSKELLPEKES
jgi:hypothetical protein